MSPHGPRTLTIMNHHLLIGVDMGGTWMRAALVSPDGTCGRIRRVPTHRNRSPAVIAGDLAALARECLGAPGESGVAVAAIAVGVPTIPAPDGTLSPSDNLPTMSGFPLGPFIEKATGLGVAVFNDANCFAAGEWWMGEGKGTRTFCGVTLGTGIGMGLIVDGRLHTGHHGRAGEIWKSPFEGGCFEQAVCGQALEKRYAELSGRHSEGPNLATLARQGDVAARQAYAEFGAALGMGLCWVANTLDPECIAFGGSIAESFGFFKDSLARALRADASGGDSVVLRQSVLGEKAALLGAARLWWEGANS